MTHMIDVNFCSYIDYRLQPGDVRGYLNMGRLLTTAGRLPEAEKVYRRARNLLPSANQGRVTVTQSHLQVFLNLAVLIAANHSRYEEADDVSTPGIVSNRT